MIQEIPTWLGVLSLTALAGLVAFAIFGLRQGAKVKKPPQNVPEDRSVDLTRWSDPRQ
jgi:hypothetical protein